MPSGQFVNFLYPQSHKDPLWLFLLKILILGSIVALLVMKSMQKVPAGHVAIKMNFDDVAPYKRPRYRAPDGGRIYLHRKTRGVVVHHVGDPVIIGAGLFVGIPFRHNLRVVSIRERQHALDDIKGEPQPGRFITIVPWVTWRVIDPVRAVINLEDVEVQVKLCCSDGVRRLTEDNSVTVSQLWSALQDDDAFRNRVAYLGVEVVGLWITSANPTEPTQLAIAWQAAGNREAIPAILPKPGPMGIPGGEPPALRLAEEA